MVGNDVRYYDTASRQIYSQLGATGDTVAEVVLGAGRERVADGLDLGAALPQENKGKLFLDANQLNGFSLGRLRVAAGRSITVDAALRGADGGEITLYAPDVDVKANLTSRGGLIQAGNVLYQPLPGRAARGLGTGPGRQPEGAAARLARHAGRARRLGQSAAGRRRPGRPAGARRRRIALRGTGDVAVDAGSVLDVTAGASLVSDGKLQGGKGGNVTLASHVLGQIPSNGGLLSFAGERGYGVTGGGTLSVASGGKIVLGGPLMRRTPPRCGWTRRCSAPPASTRSTATRA